MEGICGIKTEFLLNTPKTENENVKRSATDSFDVNDSEAPPDAKKAHLSKREQKKQRGQNKSRKICVKFLNSDNLCKSLFDGPLSEQKCLFTNCKFMHDAKKYLDQKQADIGQPCYIYSTRGFCARGLSCRFAESHTDANFNNIRRDDYDPNAKATTLNLAPFDLRVTLRKRAYNLDLSKEIIQKIDKERKEKKGELKNEAENGELAEVKNAAENGELTEVKNEAENENLTKVKNIGPILDTNRSERNTINFRNKLILSPLTTVGNLPFRRICKEFGADVTCGEMACAVPICNGLSNEWALIKRHESEDIFGVQLCGNNPQLLTFACQILKENASIDFIDLNLGCPIELIYGQGAGSALLRRLNVLEAIVRSCSTVLDRIPFTVKTRTGVYSDKSIAHELVPKFERWGASAVTVHGRSREQRYTKRADWQYIEECASKAVNIPVIGNGDILSYEDYNNAKKIAPSISSLMIGRGALIKPWIFQEIKEQKHWDPSSSERFDILKKYINYGLEHWGSDAKGVENTRRFFLEWQSFLYRYVPYGLLERPPQRINERPDPYCGRDDLETLMASSKCSDWIKLSEMFLGPVPDNFQFIPKHKANAF